MSSGSNYLENKLVDHVFRSATFAKPAQLWVALCTDAPTDVGGGTEPAGGGYARVQNNPSDSNWTATQGGVSGVSSGTGGQTTNAVDLIYPSPSADWNLITHVKVMDASVGGNMLAWGVLDTPLLVKNGDPAPRFLAGTLVVTFA